MKMDWTLAHPDVFFSEISKAKVFKYSSNCQRERLPNWATTTLVHLKQWPKLPAQRSRAARTKVHCDVHFVGRACRIVRYAKSVNTEPILRFAILGC